MDISNFIQIVHAYELPHIKYILKYFMNEEGMTIQGNTIFLLYIL